jgi:hypothetical protein
MGKMQVKCIAQIAQAGKEEFVSYSIAGNCK